MKVIYTILLVIALGMILPDCTCKNCYASQPVVPILKADSILLYNDSDGTYAQILSKHYKDKMIIRSNAEIISFLSLHGEEGTIIESFSDSAFRIRNSGVKAAYRADYLATPVIAVDKSKTRLPITSWRDLDGIDEYVFIDELYIDYILAAASYGLEGKNYTLNEILRILKHIKKRGRLVQNKNKASILLCFDYQAVHMKHTGRDVNIVIPSEGTISYERGLLGSEKELNIDTKELKKDLYNAGFRLTDKGADYTPDAGSYSTAYILPEDEGLRMAAQSSFKRFKREVLGEKLLASADGIEQQELAFIYITAVILWIGYAVKRVMRLDIRKAIFMIGGMLAAWGMIRFLKYQVNPKLVFARYLWFSYYIFMLAIPSTLLWIGCRIRHDENIKRVDSWFYIIMLLDVLLLTVVFTNDLHHSVFKYSDPDVAYTKNYTYNIMYYIIMLYIFFKILLAVIIFNKASSSNLNRLNVTPVILIIVFLAAYAIAYIGRIDIVFNTDITIVVGAIGILSFELIVHTGMIPMNSDYERLIKNSTMNIAIFDLYSECVLSSSGKYINQEDLFIRKKTISGGSVIWEEDIGNIRALKRNLERAAYMIDIANSMLTEEEIILKRSETMRVRNELLNKLNFELFQMKEVFTDMLARYRQSADPKLLAQIMLLLCYIKRRCNLFFRKNDDTKLSCRECAIYMDELAQLAAYADSNCILVSETEKYYSGELINFLYDFYYTVIAHCVRHNINSMFRLSSENSDCSLSSILTGSINLDNIPERMREFVKAYGGRLVISSMGKSHVLTLSFSDFENKNEIGSGSCYFEAEVD